jgi:hypothetical protein
VPDAIAEINKCKYLFLSEIEELDHNGLRLVVEEGRPCGEAKPLHVGESVITGGTRIDVTEESRAFELVWNRYVAYSVLNESYASVDADERYVGTRFRVYSKSHFIEYVSRASFATPEYPGPTQHYEVVCENHIVDVISTATPSVQVLKEPARPANQPSGTVSRIT